MAKLKLYKLTVALLLGCIAAAGQTAPVAKEQSWTGKYRNYEYGYTVRIPAGFVGLSPASPWPQHGIEINLTPGSEAAVYTSGYFSSVDYSSLDAAVNSDVNDLRKRSSDLQIVSRRTERLGKLRAIRVIARYKQASSGISFVQETITAIRWSKRPEEGVTCTLTLVTPEQRYANDTRLLSAIMHSWRLRPLP
jgi:hypothetical protein